MDAATPEPAARRSDLDATPDGGWPTPATTRDVLRSVPRAAGVRSVSDVLAEDRAEQA